MIKIFSSNNKQFIKSVEKSEADLNRFLSEPEHWDVFFPQFIFIKSEFSLNGDVRSKGGPGRVDIFAFNSRTKKFVIIELKRDLDKNIRNQASDYKDFVENNFSDIYISATQDYDIELPKRKDIISDSIELVLIAKDFTDSDVDKAKKSNGEITLIKHMWFDNELLLIHYLNNEHSELIGKEIKKYSKPIEPKSQNIRPDVTNVLGGMLTLNKKSKEVIAYGEYFNGKNFKVFAGSSVSRSEAPKFITSNRKAFDLRKKYENDGTIVNRKFTKDIVFGSISLATSVIIGDSQNGQEWQ